jgi:serine/threonine-protein kinase
MGAVYVAEQVSMGRSVALKVLKERSGQDERVVEGFQQEARLMARLDPRYVTTIYDFDQAEDGRLFLVMELLEGETLSAMLKRMGALDLRRALALATQIAEGLSVAHRAGVIHRDVKPQNIMVRPDNTIKVMDFGIARLRDAGGGQLTSMGVIMGTPEYMAPERIRTGLASERTDIYSFGVMLYEMLAGEVPFNGPTPSDVIARRLQVGSAPRPLRTLRPDVPSEVEQVVLQAMERDPEQRPRDMGEILAQLKAVAERLWGDQPADAAVETPPVASAADQAVDTPQAAGPSETGPVERRAPETIGQTVAMPQTRVISETVVVPAAGSRLRFSGRRRGLVLACVALAAVATLGGGLYALLNRGRTDPSPPSPSTTAPKTTPTPSPAPQPTPTAAEPIQPEVRPPSVIEQPPRPEPPAARPQQAVPIEPAPGRADSAGPPPAPAAAPPRQQRADATGQPTELAEGRPRAQQPPAVRAEPPRAPGGTTTAPGAGITESTRAYMRAAQAQVEEGLKTRGLFKEKPSDRQGVIIEVTERGVATITGILNTRQEREQVISLARETPGITEVRARINVRESWQAPPR